MIAACTPMTLWRAAALVIGLALCASVACAQQPEPRRVPPVPIEPAGANDAWNNPWRTQLPQPVTPNPFSNDELPRGPGVAPAAYDVPLATPLINLDEDTELNPKPPF